MMITKQEAISKLDATDEAEATALRARVEAALPKYDGRPVDVGIGRATPKVVKRVMDEARAKGWSVVERHGDQREPGHWLEFS